MAFGDQARYSREHALEPVMSYTRLDIDDDGRLERRATFLPTAVRLAQVALWSVIHVVLLFAEHLAEFLAPLFLFAGALWWAIPHALDAITLEGQAADLLQVVRNRVPHEFYVDGSYYSAHTLIVDGIWLIGAVAVCRTLSMALTALLLDRR
jgi:hypothetical protein